MQKAFMLIGPPRGGKGTLSRVAQQLVGLNNVISPSLGTLGSEFGLSGLIGKQLAVIEDARNDYDRTNATTVERLLSIIGEDAVSINRKNRDYWNGTLPTRFLLVSNEVPRLGDSSGAILTRFISIKLKKSFKGKEDPNLGAKLTKELPGIFNWALDGLSALDRQGHFTQPETMAEVQDLMNDLNSPVANFLDEHPAYEFSGNQSDYVLLKDIHKAYRHWCDTVGSKPLKQANFAQAIDAVHPSIEFKNTIIDGVKARRIFGVKEVQHTNAWQISKQTA